MSKKRSLHDTTTSALERSIEVNLKLQSQLISKLKDVSVARKENRHKVLIFKKALDQHMKKKFDGNNEDEEEKNASVVSASTSQTRANKMWNCNGDMKWKRRFFVDPEKSIPEPNEDERQRRIWEGDLASGTYMHRFVPWSKIELKALEETVEEVRESQQQQKDEGEGEAEDEGEAEAEAEAEAEETETIRDAEINFHEVAERIKNKLSAKKFTPAQMTRHTYSLPDGTAKNKHIPRSWMDYRIKYLNSLSPSINKSPFTKNDSLTIIEYLHKNNGNPPWHTLASALQTSRTPFQCFQYAQTKLSHTLQEVGNASTFTKDEDELLFKYIAASGPQFVLNQHSATIIAQKLFPKMSHFQICHRAHTSLINPQFANEKWSETEERTLAMGMKIYNDSENTPAKAAGLLERRSNKMVADKWLRSMIPCYNSQPFSTEEDKALIAAVKKMKNKNKGGDGKGEVFAFASIAKKFPTRNPRWLQNRWVELAKHEDLASVKGDQMMKFRVSRLGRKDLRSVRNKRKAGTSIVVEDEVLSAADFAITFKKRPRKK